MKTSVFLNIVLAAALVCVCGRMALSSARDGKQKGTAEAIHDNIMTRSSVREYTDRPVEQGKVDSLLHAGMAAPSAVNRQPWHFIVVSDKALLKKMAELTPNARMAADAPLAIVVCGDLSKYADDETELRDFWVQDVSAATENILLEAHALGLGAVWTGTYPSEERCKKISALLSLPSHIVPLNAIVIGYPKGDAHPKDKWNPSNVSYNRYGQATAAH